MSAALISAVAGPTISGSMDEGNTKGGMVISSIDRSKRESGVADNEDERDWNI